MDCLIAWWLGRVVHEWVVCWLATLRARAAERASAWVRAFVLAKEPRPQIPDPSESEGEGGNRSEMWSAPGGDSAKPRESDCFPPIGIANFGRSSSTITLDAFRNGAKPIAPTAPGRKTPQHSSLILHTIINYARSKLHLRILNKQRHTKHIHIFIPEASRV